MTSPTQPTFNTHTADGVSTVFPYSFLLLSNNDLEVSIDGMTQARNVDYQITGTTNPDGGNVTFCTTPANASRILISRRLTLKRLSVSVDHDFDRIWQALQQLQRSTGGSIADHVQEVDPHPQYLADHEGREIVAEGITAHTRDSDPHPQYLTDTEGDAKYLTSSVSPFVATFLDDPTAEKARETLGIAEAVSAAVSKEISERAETRYVQKITIGGSVDRLYPVWWQWPELDHSISRLAIVRLYSWNGATGETRPLNKSTAHQAGLVLELDGSGTRWSGGPQVQEVKRYGYSYNKTLSHVAYNMYCKAEKHDPLKRLYPAASTAFTAQCHVRSGCYLRGGGLTYHIIKNWAGDVGWHDGSDNARRDISQSTQGDWSVNWYVEPINFSSLIEPAEDLNAYV